MTEPEALAEAKRRWGESGYVWLENTGAQRHAVGTRETNLLVLKGLGDTWEEAFDSAAQGDKR